MGEIAVGTQLGAWTVIAQASSAPWLKTKGPYWKVTCVCGETRIMAEGNLRAPRRGTVCSGCRKRTGYNDGPPERRGLSS